MKEYLDFKDYQVENFENSKLNIAKASKGKNQQDTYVSFICPECGKGKELSVRVFLQRDKLICRACKQSKALSKHVQEHKEEWVNRWKNSVKEKYGVENIAFDKETQDRKKETCKKKYGVEYAVQAKPVRDKINKSFQEKFGGNSPWCSEEVINKMLENQREKYNGKLWIQTEEFREKMKKTNLERYGQEYTGGVESVIKKKHKTCLEKYGEEESFKSKNNKEKTRETLLKKYGVEYSYEIPGRKEKAIKTLYSHTGHKVVTYKGYSYDNKNFDSSYELAYYIWLKDHDKEFIFHPFEPIPYTGNDGKEHLYLPDFIVEGRIQETKGDQFFNEKGEPWDPYGKKFWWEKYNLMKENNVEILKFGDLKFAFDYVEETYGKGFLKKCRCKRNFKLEENKKEV